MCIRDSLKPGSATQPLPGVVPALVDAEGRVLDGATAVSYTHLDVYKRQE